LVTKNGLVTTLEKVANLAVSFVKISRKAKLEDLHNLR
jgi:hypothetical protein